MRGTTHQSTFRAYCGLLLVVAIWGANFAVVKAAIEILHPLAFNAARFLLASVVIYLVLRNRGPLKVPPKEDLWAIVALGLTGNAVYQLAFIYGLDMTLAGNAAILLATTPIWALLISAKTGHDDVNGVLWASAGIGAVGIILVLTGGTKELSLGTEQLKGDLLIAFGAFCWAVFTVAGKGLLVRHGSLQVTAWTLWIGAAPLILIGIPPALATDWTILPSSVWGGILYAGLGAIGIAYTLWYEAVDVLGSSRTALWSNVIPVVGILTAWAYLGEVPRWPQIVGASLILGSVLLSKRRPASSRRAAPEAT